MYSDTPGVVAAEEQPYIHSLQVYFFRIIKLRYISAPRSWSHKEYSCLIFRHIQCLHLIHDLMYFEVAWVLASSGTQVQPQIILDPDYLPDYLSN